MKRYIYIIVSAVLACTAVSCDKFLDVMPDNRTELNTQEKLRAFLTSAYPPTDYMLLAEFSSDNVDDYGPENINTDRFIEQVYYWQETTEKDNEGTENLWGNSYIAIAAANQALESIEDLGGAHEANMEAEKAEALLCRAYSHFVLLNMFCQSYDPACAAKDMGITYMCDVEQGLNPQYQRNSVAECYDLIDKDLQAALPYVSDAYYSVPKYHFNEKAAYAFAARFYLFYQKWDLAVKYATLCLGSQPESKLRDWDVMATMTQDRDVITQHYIDATANANLLLLTAYSKMGRCTNNYYTYAKFSHGRYVAENEDGIALATLLGTNNAGFYHMPMKVYSATGMDRVIFWRIPYLFEYKDPVAGTGYYRTVYPGFTMDMALLERAEAEIMQEKYDAAAADMNIWLSNISKNTYNYSAEQIVALVNGTAYYDWEKSTFKKHLNPSFSIGEEGETKEAMLQFCLLLKRVESIGFGLRWFDVNRYGIEIVRREMDAAGDPGKLLDVLSQRDPRRALQIPRKVTDAGYTANPR